MTKNRRSKLIQPILSRVEMGCIYRIYCKDTQKSYIGQYRKDTPELRWNRHLRDSEQGSTCAIHQAIRKYGKDAFEVSVMCVCSSQEELDKKEDAYITEYNSMIYDNGYNMVRGGKGRAPDFHHKEEHRKRMSEYMKGRKLSDETKDKIRKARTGKKVNLSDEARVRKSEISRQNATGKVCSEQTRRKISEALKGRPGVTAGQKRTDEQKRRIGDAKRGTKATDEVKEKLSQKQKQRHQEHPIPHKNCKYSEDDIRYMRNNPDGLSVDELRTKFNILRYRLLQIQAGTLYKHVI